MASQWKNEQPCCTPKPLGKHRTQNTTAQGSKARQMNTNGKHK